MKHPINKVLKEENMKEETIEFEIALTIEIIELLELARNKVAEKIKKKQAD